MQLKRFIRDSADEVKRNGMEGFRDIVHSLYQGIFWRFVSRMYEGGDNVYSHDWDVLVILDACRVDLLEEVAAEYEFLTDIRSVQSVGSNSEEWLEKTFTPRLRWQTRRTACVTANPFSDSRLNETDFCALDEVWRYAWDDDLGTVPPQPVSDAAIAHWRTDECERMIVHYMQPHFPSIPRQELGVGTPGKAEPYVWEELRKGRLSEADAWDAYRENLRYVLDHVKLVVRSIDAERVAISADHANSFGSWGLYGHPRAPIKAIRTVPWCETSARNVSGYEPSETGKDVSVDDQEVRSRLRALGYI